MEGRAIARFVRGSPRRARQVAELIRGKPVEEAYAILDFTPKAAVRSIRETLRSAVHNVLDLDESRRIGVEDLVVKRIHVDEGPRLKRIRPRAMGRAFRIRKQSNHVTVVVGLPDED
ncbi:MAG: 50S ribosomal protein L22 [Gemmatimonadetes bacterium]|nr:50S ribosomal protein L22 [Gemmatimonadota bacterium]